MRKVAHIAAREFVATVGTKGFLVGLLLMPAVIMTLAIASPRLFSQRNFLVQGQIAIVDPTGAVTNELRTAVDPGTIEARRKEDARRALAAAPPAVRQLAQNAPTNSSQAAELVLGPIPKLTVVARPQESDVQREKEWLTQAEQDDARHLALVVVHPDAVVPANGSTTYGAYDLYVPANLDDRIETLVQQSLREAIVAARARAGNLDRGRIDALMRVDRVPSVMVTKGAERPTVGAANTSPVLQQRSVHVDLAQCVGKRGLGAVPAFERQEQVVVEIAA